MLKSIISIRREKPRERRRKMKLKNVVALGIASSMVWGTIPVNAEETAAHEANLTKLHRQKQRIQIQQYLILILTAKRH